MMPLDPEIAAYLEAQKRLPPRAGLTLDRTRARLVQSAAQNGGEIVSVPEVNDLHLPGEVRVRDYRAGADFAVVYYHGGRFISGDLESHDRLCRRLAVAAR